MASFRIDRAARYAARERTCVRGHMYRGPFPLCYKKSRVSVYADAHLRMHMQVSRCPPLEFSQPQILPILTKPGIEPYLLTSRHVENDVVGPSEGYESWLVELHPNRSGDHIETVRRREDDV